MWQVLKSNDLVKTRDLLMFGFDTIAVHFQHRKLFGVNACQVSNSFTGMQVDQYILSFSTKS